MFERRMKSVEACCAYRKFNFLVIAVCLVIFSATVKAVMFDRPEAETISQMAARKAKTN